MAYAATIKEDRGQFAMVMRFIVMPLFLFSGTFFPLDTLPLGRPLDRLDLADLAWNGTWPGGQLRVRGKEPWLTIVHLVFLLGLAAAGWVLTKRQFVKRMAS